MAKPQFNRNLFNAKKQESDNRQFPDVSSGTYICDVKKAYLTEAKTNANKLMAVFAYQIADDSPDFPNQYIFEYISLTDGDGNDQEGGYNALAIKLSQLKVNAGAEVDIESSLDETIGSRVRLEYTAGDDSAPDGDSKRYSKFRIKRLIHRADGSSAVEGYRAANTGPTADELDSADAGIEIEAGMIVTLNTNEKFEIIALLEKEQSEDGKDYLMVKPIGGSMAQMKKICLEDVTDCQRPEPTTGKVTEERPSQQQTAPVAAKPAPAASTGPVSSALAKAKTVTPVTADDLDDDLDSPIVEDEVVEEEDEPTIAIDSKVTATSAKTGKGIVGLVKNLDVGGMIEVHWKNDQGQTVKSMCKPETVKLV